MKLRLFSLAAIIIFFAASSSIFAQINTVLGMFTDSPAESFAGGVSGDGRFVVIESRGNIATVNPRNADNNVEIFLFDYAQRRIFQITDTKAVLIDPDKGTVFSNIRVEIINTRPTISNDGRWIAFSSNATTSTPEKPDATNPGSFDGNDHTDKDDENPLTLDGNLEMWLYEIPAYTPADLTEGDELPLTPLDTGAFTRVTNTPPSQLPVPGTETSGAFVADDNHDASINDDGTVLAFVSTRDLIKGGNPFPEADNDEIFTYSRVAGTIGQVTETPRGPISNPIYNKNPSISGDGTRIVFTSTGDNPIVGMTGGENPESSRNEEIFIANLAAGVPAGDQRQITVTTPLNPGNPVNILDLGRRISRDGRFVAFDSYADLADEHGGTNQTAFASFIYDYTDESFARVLPRSDADSGAGGGDVQRYPGFTDYDANGTPSSIILHSRMNITPVGTIPTDEDDGLNPLTGRPVQFYRYPITLIKPDPKDPEAIFTRLTSFPAPNASILPSSQPLLSNTSNRIVFNLAIALLGTGNFDQLAEVYYSYEPPVVNQAVGVMSFATGASRMPISPEEVPTPTPTPTPSPTPSPTPTPTPTPNPSPTPTPSPSPSPTPETPPAVHGLGNGMLAVLHLSASNNLPITPKTAVGAIDRRFMLPMELGGVSMTIGGINCGLKSISRREIIFVAPQALPIPLEGQEYEVIINNRGTEIRGKVTIVVTRPDVFRADLIPAPGGRAFAHNVVNRVHTTEPFTSNTIQIRGGKRVPTRLRLRATGIANAGASVISVGFGSQFTGTSAFAIAMPVLVEPGIYAFDILVPAALNEAGDVPITITVNAAGTLFRSRLDDTAPRLNFL